MCNHVKTTERGTWEQRDSEVESDDQSAGTEVLARNEMEPLITFTLIINIPVPLLIVLISASYNIILVDVYRVF